MYDRLLHRVCIESAVNCTVSQNWRSKVGPTNVVLVSDNDAAQSAGDLISDLNGNILVGRSSSALKTGVGLD